MRAMPDGGLPPSVLDIDFSPKQLLAFQSKATEALFGGSAGPGKSHGMRISAIMWCSQIPGLQVYLFRRVMEDLIKNHMEGPKGFRNLLAPWVQAKYTEIIDDQIRFKNGSRIYLCHCKDERHMYKYHGSEIHVLMPDELTTFTESIYRYLRFRVRMVGITLPDFYRAGCIGLDGEVNEWNLFPRVMAASNPGNIGHHWVKRTWGLDTGGILEPTKQSDIEGGLHRAYIPARLSDNKHLEHDDPDYRARMRGLGDPALVRAMEEGDWNILAGGFFPEFRLERHVLKAVTLPEKLFTRKFRAHDWGSAKPFSSGWYAIADEDWHTEGTLGNEIIVPRGALVRYREWYGSDKSQGKDNIGLKLPADRWAKGVLTRTSSEESIIYDTIDPATFSEDGGPSIAERAGKVTLGNRRMNLRPADNKRTAARGAMGGWDQMRARLQGPDPEAGDPPLLFLMDNQPDGIRIIQAVQHDPLKPEDLDTDMEDHAVDECRYACMSRPLPAMKAQDRRPQVPKFGTFAFFDYMDKQYKRSTYHIDTE